MNKTTIIIIALAFVILLTAVIGVVGFITSSDESPFGDGKTSESAYSLQPTTTYAVPTATESWIDLNMIASNLATATDSDTDTSLTSGTLAPIVIGSMPNNQPLTTIVYIDQNGNIVDMNQINQNKTTTQMDNTIAFDETQPTTGEDTSFSEYEINSNGVITRYLGTSKTLFIPENIQGVTVTGIGSRCFEGSSITAVQIPKTVKNVGAAAFKDCKKLVTVNFVDPSVDVVIENSAFKGCSSLKSIKLPITSSIGMSAFESCTSLKEIDIKAGTKNIGQYCFAFCSSLTSITIRDEETKFNGITTFQAHNEALIVHCAPDSNVEFQLKGYGLNTAPISG